MMRITRLLSVAAILSTGFASAQGPSIPLYRFLGVVGIAGGQTARLNVLNPPLPAPFALGARCASRLSFLDDQGQELKSASVTVDPGKSLSLDLNRDTDVSSDSSRAEIHALVSTPPVGPPSGDGSQPQYCTLIPTLEIVDNATGRTITVLTASEVRNLAGAQPAPARR